MDIFEYKAHCAALAFHKAIIAISELKALSDRKEMPRNTKMRGSKALYTYYAVYHVFCACILITPKQIIDSLGLNMKQQFKPINEEILNWQIKEFCKKLRSSNQEEWTNGASFLVPLYQNFVDAVITEGKCIPGLYEKLCYIRDRVIHRPSYVVDENDESYLTSKYLGEEIESLPSAEALYQIVVEIYSCIIGIGFSAERDNICTRMIELMWGDIVRYSDLDSFCALGHRKRRLQYLGRNVGNGAYIFPTYIAHLLELEDIDFIRDNQKKYWLPLYEQYLDVYNS